MINAFKWVILMVACCPIGIARADKPVDIPYYKLGGEFRILGILNRPLGELVTIQGIAIDGRTKADNVRLMIQRVNGRATQERAEIKHSPRFGWNVDKEPKIGVTYELRGFEDGGYTGVPAWALKEIGMRTTGFYFRVTFAALKVKEIAAIEFGPGDFLDQFAVVDGKAHSQNDRGYLVGKDWKLLVLPQAGWPAHMEGRLIEVEGVMRKPAQRRKDYELEKGKSRLVRLEEQVGRKVELEGRAWVVDNTQWKFYYRDTDVYVENLHKLPGWTANCHGQEMVITGTLEKAQMPRPDEIGSADREQKEYFRVRDAGWKAVGPTKLRRPSTYVNGHPS